MDGLEVFRGHVRVSLCSVKVRVPHDLLQQEHVPFRNGTGRRSQGTGHRSRCWDRSSLATGKKNDRLRLKMKCRQNLLSAGIRIYPAPGRVP